MKSRFEDRSTYVDVDSGEREDPRVGMLFGNVSEELLSSFVPFDGV